MKRFISLASRVAGLIAPLKLPLGHLLVGLIKDDRQSGSRRMGGKTMRPIFRTRRLRGLWLLEAVLAVLIAHPTSADSFIWINVSVKVIVDPANGQVPSTMDDAALRDSFEDMNRWLANTWRGYRLQMVDLQPDQNFRRIGGLCGPNPTLADGPCFFYDKDLKYGIDPNTNELWMVTLDNAAKADKTLYGWNDFAINIYFNNVNYSRASSPESDQDIIICAYPIFVDQMTDSSGVWHGFGPTYMVGGNLLHEIGHWFGFAHTFEEVYDDTAQDPNEPDSRNEPVVLDSIAQYNNWGPFSGLAEDDYRRTRVWNTANNAMSYYQLFYDDPPWGGGKVLTDAERFEPTRFIFTEFQMDKWADWANVGRGLAVTSGRTWYVKPGVIPGGDGSSANEFQLISQAETAANDAGGDILLLRQGIYEGPMVITKPLTLRATRQGSTVLGQ